MGIAVALVGAGRMGRAHLNALGQTQRVRVVAVVDPSSEARSVARAQDLAAFASVEELLRSASVDAAVVAAPTDSHLEVLRTMIGAGLPVLCEKPCGRTPEEAREAGELADRAGVTLQIGYWRRFVPSLIALRERIVRGDLGQPSLISCFQWDERPPPASFRATSGGILVDMGVHEFDQMRWLTGQEIVGTSGFASGVAFDPPVEGDWESVAVAVMLSRGAVGLVSLGRRSPLGETCQVQVIGTQGAEDLPFVSPPDGEATISAALVAQAEAFADAIEGGPMLGAPVEDAVAALEAAFLARKGTVGA